MSTISSRLLRELVRLPHYKLLALALALFAWLYVQGGQLVEAQVEAEVRWTLPEGLITAEEVPASVSVTLAGSRSAIRRAERAELTQEVDISEATVGDHHIDFTAYELEGLPPAVTVIGVSPSSQRIFLDRVSSRQVVVAPVTLSQDGHEVHLEPEVVQVRGPRTVVANLTEIPTDPLDLSEVVEDTELPVSLELPWGVTVIGDRPTHATVEVDALIEERTITEVPVHVLGAPGWQPHFTEVEVTVEGPGSELDGLEPHRMVAMVHLPDPLPEDPVEVAFGPRQGPRIEVVHGAREVEVIEVEPATLTVEEEGGR